MTLWLEAGISRGMDKLNNLTIVFIISPYWDFDTVDGYCFYWGRGVELKGKYSML